MTILLCYFEDRKQIVKIGNVVSLVNKVNCEVLQGSVLGPQFFLIFINDMLNLFANDIVAFADDTTIIYDGKDWNKVEADANFKINIVNNWLKKQTRTKLRQYRIYYIY